MQTSAQGMLSTALHKRAPALAMLQTAQAMATSALCSCGQLCQGLQAAALLPKALVPATPLAQLRLDVSAALLRLYMMCVYLLHLSIQAVKPFSNSSHRDITPSMPNRSTSHIS